MSSFGLMDEIAQFTEREDFSVLRIIADRMYYSTGHVRVSVTARCGKEGVTFDGRGEYLLELIRQALMGAIELAKWTEETTDE